MEIRNVNRVEKEVDKSIIRAEAAHHVEYATEWVTGSATIALAVGGLFAIGTGAGVPLLIAAGVSEAAFFVARGLRQSNTRRIDRLGGSEGTPPFRNPVNERIVKTIRRLNR